MLETVHTREYIRKVKEFSASGGFLAESTYLSPGSYEAAALSAGGAIAAARAVLSGQFRSAVSLGRPPGHHAGPDQGGGFCIFNNAAVAAKYCLEQGDCHRVLILDWDLHHGNGTQAVAWQEPDIIFCSFHQFGPELYPETGAVSETGPFHNIINVPLPAYIGDHPYLDIFLKIVPPLVRQCKPDIIIVSAGFDGHFNDINHLYLYDPGAGFNLTSQLYHKLTSLVARTAVETGSRYIMLLEGGYNQQNLGNCLANAMAAICELAPPVIEQLPPDSQAIIEFDPDSIISSLNREHRGYWSF